MSFNISGGVTEVWRCTECGWCQIKANFKPGPSCVMCDGAGEKMREQESTTGMSNFAYRQLLDEVEEHASGVGAATVDNIEQHFDDGNNFLDAAEDAYQEMDYDTLKEVSGIGTESAKQIALTVADYESWEGGALFVL